jgi:hypothetical protein
MAGVVAILAAFRETIIDADLMRRASEAGPTKGPPYPCIIQPVDGAPAPGELAEEDHDHTELVVSMIHSGDMGEDNGYDARIRRRVVIDLRYRSRNVAAHKTANDLNDAVEALLINADTNYGYGFTIGVANPVVVHEAKRWAGFSPIHRSRATGYDDVAKYMLEVPR